jgi:hypothetical protein
MRVVREIAGQLGIHLPFTGVVCLDATQTIAIQADGGAQVTVKQTLVFLEPPSPGDLRDTYGLGPAEPFSSIVYASPDAIELGREGTDDGRLRLSWLPRDAVSLYRPYSHQTGWMPSISFNRWAVSVEYDCDMRTGVVTIELVSPVAFEAAVILPRPLWYGRMTERQIIGRALRLLEGRRDRAHVTDEGRHVQCTVAAPRVGDRYVFVAFREGGVAQWEDHLKTGEPRRLTDVRLDGETPRSRTPPSLVQGRSAGPDRREEGRAMLEPSATDEAARR